MSDQALPDIPVPSGRAQNVKAAVLHVTSLAHYAIVAARGWAANSINARVRLAADNNGLNQEVQLLREELRIKDTRLAKIGPRHRPFYSPVERMAILELKAARGWSLAQAHKLLGHHKRSFRRKVDVTPQVSTTTAARGAGPRTVPACSTSGGSSDQENGIIRTQAAFIAAIAALGAAQLASGGEGDWIGYGGPNGTRVYPDTRPPTTFTQKDVAWACELPSWGHGSPIVVGTKAFLQVEPLEGQRLFPALICIDTATGKILSDSPFDQTAAIPEAEAKPAIEAWKKAMDDYARRQQLCREYHRSQDTRAMEVAGYEWNARWNKVVRRDEKPIVDLLRTAQKAGFTLETWRHGCSGGSTMCVGQAYATPASDGQRAGQRAERGWTEGALRRQSQPGQGGVKERERRVTNEFVLA